MSSPNEPRLTKAKSTENQSTDTQSVAVQSAKTRVAKGAGPWANRPAGVPGAVPPPSVPLSFLAASGAGLIACGVAWVVVRSAAATSPSADQVVAAVHFGVLAALTMGILGATHQFTPVITGRPMRSIPLAHVTFLTWLAASWMLPLGVGLEQVAVTGVAGGLALVGLVALLWNLIAPLSVAGKGAPVTALRLALIGAATTTLMGALFVGDRQGNWFNLASHVDLSMGVVGLFAWLGVTYIGVAEKLWPMFMLAHLPAKSRSGSFAVWVTWIGAMVLAIGLAPGVAAIEWVGGAVLVLGLFTHLVSLGEHLRHRRRKADLHLVFVVTAAAWLISATVLGLAGAIVLKEHYDLGVSLIAAAMVAGGGWLVEALVGHAHKVVPFIVWSLLRSRGVSSGPSGKQLMFADLFNHTWATITYATVTLGIGTLCAGLATSSSRVIAVGGVLLALTGVIATANLTWRPWRLRNVGVSDARPTT